jgi:pimeloyl-ACP methyl ester carboxylesterase
MPIVFVHGVPDTARVWDAVISRLDGKDVVTLSLPGFGCPLPEDFSATKEAYVDWLIKELSQLSKPIDLIGHDWGAMLVMRAVMKRPDLIRSWVAGAAPIDREYQWHETARLWQTPTVGEQLMENLTPQMLQGGLVLAGVPANDVAIAARQVDATMKQCILKLYRSAINLGAEWQDDLKKINRPGLILWGEQDPYASIDFGRRLAEQSNAKFIALDCSHWWQLQQPDEVAAQLENLLASLSEE